MKSNLTIPRFSRDVVYRVLPDVIQCHLDGANMIKTIFWRRMMNLIPLLSIVRVDIICN